MDKFEANHMFLEVVAQGSFTAAGRALGVPLATISRKVRQLETALGTELLTRTTRQLSLTEAGRMYHRDISAVLDRLSEAEHTISKFQSEPTGELTIASPVPFGRQFLLPAIAAYQDAYPQITVRHIMRDTSVDFVASGIDVGIKIGKQRDSGLRLAQIGQSRVVLAASPKYLKRAGPVNQPADVLRHDCLTLSLMGRKPVWLFQTAPGREDHFAPKVKYIANSVEAVIEYACRGGGLVQLYDYQLAPFVQSGALVSLLRHAEIQPRSIAMLYPETRNLPPKTRNFIDLAAPMLRARLSETAQLDI